MARSGERWWSREVGDSLSSVTLNFLEQDSVQGSRREATIACEHGDYPCYAPVSKPTAAAAKHRETLLLVKTRPRRFLSVAKPLEKARSGSSQTNTTDPFSAHLYPLEIARRQIC